MAYAGVVYNTANSSYYLYTGAYYWTMSPYLLYADSNVFEFSVYSSGALNSLCVNTYIGLLPSVSLSSEAKVTDGGTGVYNNPYIIVAN